MTKTGFEIASSRSIYQISGIPPPGMTPFYPIFNNGEVGKSRLNSKKGDVTQTLRDSFLEGRIDCHIAVVGSKSALQLFSGNSS
jgi:hypothetical protein